MAATAFVTGGGGFAGRHLVERLLAQGDRVVAPTSREMDLCDAAQVEHRIEQVSPAAVFHLAAQSSPSRSFEIPRETLTGNLEMTLNLLEAVRKKASGATVVLVGSSQIYGTPRALPIDESASLAPRNPYAASKAACDLLGLQYELAHGMSVVRLRPFNHAGPGQADEYVIGSLARQVADAEAAGGGVLRTGNTEVARDFTDVRDVARAYALTATLEGGAFNVCSGRASSVGELVQIAVAEARCSVRVEVEGSRLRPDDTKSLYGSHAKLTAATGWEPEIPVEQTVREAIDWWRTRLL